MAATPTASRILFSISPCAGRGSLRVLAEELAGVVAPADLFAVVGMPGAGLVDDLGRTANVDDLALAADAFAVEDVELGRLERG